MSEIIVGIDLGTTNSEIAVWEDQNVKVIDGENGPILPSYVGLDDSGNILIGEAARNQYTAYPERTVRSVKRLMGSGKTVTLGDQDYTPQEISAMILRKLKDMAQEYLGGEVHKAVITVPAFFSDVQRQATREAGEIAGLEVVKMINEPTAATLVYEGGSKDSKRVLVYDLGGGTFDVSVVSMDQGVIEVVASHGNNALGGDDFDQRIVAFITDYLMEEHGIRDIPVKAMARIARAAESAKKTLSVQPFVTVREEYLLKKDGVPFHLEVEISRREYEEMIESYIEETLDAVHLVLRDADMVASDIDEILLVGGSTRTPVIQERLEQVFGKQPRSEVDPDLCVAAGAAIQAAMIGGSHVHAVLVDVTPYTFGTSALDELDGQWTPHRFVPIIRRNTPVPVTRSEVFYTAFPYQEAVEIRVYQGENENALDNIEVGRFTVEGLRKDPDPQEIIATFTLDTNGMLQVSAMEKATGLQKKITISNVLSGSGDDDLAKARQRVSRLFGDDSDQVPMDSGAGQATRRESAMIKEAEEVISRARALLEDVEDDDREDLVDMIEAVDSAMVSDDAKALKDAVEELSDLIFYLES